jgi:hypothetical protein
MTVKRPLLVAACALVLACFAAASTNATAADTSASTGLVSALQKLRSINSSFIIAWSADPRPPQTGDDSISKLKRQILALDSQDREALIFWLHSHGRDALHQRGATDPQIGPPLFPIDYNIAWVPLPDGFVNPTPMPTPTPVPTESPTPKPQSHSNPFYDFLGAVILQKIVNPNKPLAIQMMEDHWQGKNPSNPAVVSTTIASSSHSETHMEGNTLVTNSSGSSLRAGVDVGGLALLLVSEALKEHPSSQPLQTAVANEPRSAQWQLLELGRQRTDVDTHGITVENGVAGIRNNSEGGACLGFTNHNQRTVKEIDFDLTLVDANDHMLQAVGLRRTGSFAPNEKSEAPHDLDIPAIEREDANCITLGRPQPDAPSTAPLARTAAVAYEIRRVVYDDGTQWLRDGANVWPAP